MEQKEELFIKHMIGKNQWKLTANLTPNQGRAYWVTAPNTPQSEVRPIHQAY